MSGASVRFFPVGNGDMTLITLWDGTTILIDVNIRSAADDPNDATFDVAGDLRKRLKKDAQGRPYVDVFLLSHPDEDHCRGLSRHFHLAALSAYQDKPPEGEELKIIVREMWSSALVFRRASKILTLCEDAKAFNKEAHRRIQLFRQRKKLYGSYVRSQIDAGDRILVIGEDENGKTDDLSEILMKVDERYSKVNNEEKNQHISMFILGPLPKQENEEDEDALAKNRSSVVIQFTIAADSAHQDSCVFLTAGDAEVLVWEKLWDKHWDGTSVLEYDLLQTPHHCSWHSLSWDSLSKVENPRVSPKAKSALSQAKGGAFIVATSKPIKNDGNDPPSFQAKNVYSGIAKTAKGEFLCSGEYPNERTPESLEFAVTTEGPQKPAQKSEAKTAAAAGQAITRQPYGHG